MYADSDYNVVLTKLRLKEKRRVKEEVFINKWKGDKQDTEDTKEKWNKIKFIIIKTKTHKAKRKVIKNRERKLYKRKKKLKKYEWTILKKF